MRQSTDNGVDFEMELITKTNKMEKTKKDLQLKNKSVDIDTLIEDLDDKRIIGVTLDENMWHYCRKETAEYLLNKYEIKIK